LRIAGANAERVQLQNFAREIFIEPFAAAQAGDRVRANGPRVVEVHQHCRMRLDREQHGAELAEYMGANGFALKRASKRTHLTFVGGDAEMTGPEPDQPLDKTDLGTHRGLKPRLGLFQIELLGNARPRFGLAAGAFACISGAFGIEDASDGCAGGLFATSACSARAASRFALRP